MGAGGEKRLGLSKDSVPMAASFQNSLEMKNNENHCGEQYDPGRRVPTSGLAKSPCSWFPEGSPVGQSPGDLSLPNPCPFLFSSQAGEWFRPSAGPTAKAPR